MFLNAGSTNASLAWAFMQHDRDRPVCRMSLVCVTRHWFACYLSILPVRVSTPDGQEHVYGIRVGAGLAFGVACQLAGLGSNGLIRVRGLDARGILA